MKKTIDIIQEKGRFSMIDFSISHNQILYRSRDIESNINTDILFAGVRYMELPIQISDCTIQFGSAEDTHLARSKFDFPSGSRTFVVEQSGYKHLVVADKVLIQTNTKDFSESSIPINTEPQMSHEDMLKMIAETEKLIEEKGHDWVLENVIQNTGDWKLLE